MKVIREKRGDIEREVWTVIVDGREFRISEQNRMLHIMADDAIAVYPVAGNVVDIDQIA